MKPIVKWLIGALVFCAIVGNTVVTLVVLTPFAMIGAGKLLEWRYDVDHPSGHHYYED